MAVPGNEKSPLPPFFKGGFKSLHSGKGDLGDLIKLKEIEKYILRQGLIKNEMHLL